MPITIKDLQKKYSPKIDYLDLELLLAHTLKKPREFVLAHPEKKLTARQAEKFESLAKRRINHEPIAYLTGHKEFYGLDFEVTPATLIPRPETELIVEEAGALLRSMLRNKLAHCSFSEGEVRTNIIDVGTGSGNIIISLTKKIRPTWTSDVQMRLGHRMSFFGLDISKEALVIAHRNAKKNNVNEIKFLQSDLLEHFLKNASPKIKNSKMILLANLPYLSQEIYSATAPTVKKFEPKSALYSANAGLAHYEKLFKQINILRSHETNKLVGLTTILEFSPEQKPTLEKIIKKHFSKAKIKFQKDLAGKWRLVTFTF